MILSLYNVESYVVLIFFQGQWYTIFSKPSLHANIRENDPRTAAAVVAYLEDAHEVGADHVIDFIPVGEDLGLIPEIKKC